MASLHVIGTGNERSRSFGPDLSRNEGQRAAGYASRGTTDDLNWEIICGVCPKDSSPTKEESSRSGW